MIIDKDAMVDCFQKEYVPMLHKHFFISNRYYVYFVK